MLLLDDGFSLKLIPGFSLPDIVHLFSREILSCPAVTCSSPT